MPRILTSPLQCRWLPGQGHSRFGPSSLLTPPLLGHVPRLGVSAVSSSPDASDIESQEISPMLIWVNDRSRRRTVICHRSPSSGPGPKLLGSFLLFHRWRATIGTPAKHARDSSAMPGFRLARFPTGPVSNRLGLPSASARCPARAHTGPNRALYPLTADNLKGLALQLSRICPESRRYWRTSL